jgi:hypothetical protein
MRNVSDKDIEKIKTHILCAITFFLNIAVVGIMWKNIIQPERPQMIIQGDQKSLCAPGDYSTKDTQKYFKQFQSLTMIT